MALFAIVRQGGEVDLVEGTGIWDVANRFGWPGDGDIQEYNAALHPTIRQKFMGENAVQQQRDYIASLDHPAPAAAPEPAPAPTAPPAAPEPAPAPTAPPAWPGTTGG